MKPIVVIDDDHDVRDVIVFALENDGFSVSSFENGKEGLDALNDMTTDNLPGLIIVDYLMPEMDGVTFINQIKNIFPKLSKIPVAISSAMGAMNSAIIKDNDIILLHKPMDLDDLLKVARHHCV